jgi:hypothetical protein
MEIRSTTMILSPPVCFTRPSLLCSLIQPASDIKQKDHLATATSLPPKRPNPFAAPQKGRGATGGRKPAENALPILQWCLGVRMLPCLTDLAHYYLVWEENSTKLIVRLGAPGSASTFSFDLRVDKDVASLEARAKNILPSPSVIIYKLLCCLIVSQGCPYYVHGLANTDENIFTIEEFEQEAQRSQRLLHCWYVEQSSV